MKVTITDGGKTLYNGSIPGVLLITGMLVNREKKAKTQTYKLVARSWGPPQLLSALALGGIKYLGKMRILATKDKSWIKVYEETREESRKEARKKLVQGVVALVNRYAPLTMQIEPVVKVGKTELGESSVKQTRVDKIHLKRKKSIKEHFEKKRKKKKHKKTRVIVGPGGDE